MKYITYTRPLLKENYFADPQDDNIVQTPFTDGNNKFLAYLKGDVSQDVIDLFSIVEVDDPLVVLAEWYHDDTGLFRLVDGVIIDDRPVEELI